LSKRDGDQLGFPVFPLEWTDPETGEVSSGYRESGYLPVALVNYLALLGWHPAGDQELFTMPELIEAFELERVGKSGVKFNKEKLQFFNGHYIRETPNAEFLPLLKEYLTAAMVPHPSDNALLSLIDLLKERVQLLPDFYRESHYFFFAPQLTAEDYASKAWKADFVPVFTAIAEALRLLDNWTADSIKATVQEVAQSHGVKFGQLMPMLRLAATGTNAGPGVFEILEWLGQMEVNDRFAAALAGQA
jgi:glutamyl-tRNA synthetase